MPNNSMTNSPERKPHNQSGLKRIIGFCVLRNKIINAGCTYDYDSVRAQCCCFIVFYYVYPYI